MAFYFIELTDTFGGETNYSWVTRVKVRANTLRGAIWRFSRDAGFSGRVRHEYTIPDEHGTQRFKIRGAALCFFACEWDDDAHGNYRVKEL